MKAYRLGSQVVKVYRVFPPASVSAPSSGGASLIKVGSSFTIPTSGGVAITVDPSDAFTNGQSENVVIRQVGGVLSRSGTTYTFTRNDAGSTVNIAQGMLISVIGESVFSGLAADSQGLTLVNKELGLLPTGDDIDLHSREVYTESVRPLPPEQTLTGQLAGKQVVKGIATQDLKILAALLDDETFFFNEIYTKFFRPIGPNDLGLVAACQSLDGKVLAGVRADGFIYCQGIVGGSAASGGSAVATDSNGTTYLTLLNQVYRQDGIFSQQLTTLGDNSFSSLSHDEQKLYFYSTRDGAQKRFWMNPDGSNQFYADLDPYLFTDTIFHVIWTGQSLSEGATSTAQSTIQPYANLKFNGGVKPGSTAGNLASFVPLTENSFERGTVAFSNVLTKYARDIANGNSDPGGDDNVFLISAVGVGARRLLEIKKNPGGAAPEPSFANSIAQAVAGKSIADSQGKGFETPFIVFHHGESDDAYFRTQSPTYKELLLTFWQEYNTDLKAATGQTRDVKILMSQTSAWTNYNKEEALSAIQQYEIWEEHPDKYTLVCAKYWIPVSDGVHLFASGYQALNELMAIAAHYEAHQNKPFKPLHPESITRDGTTVTVSFHVPVWPLVFDTTTVTDPGNYGFEYYDSGNAPIAINSVSLGADKSSVIIELASGAPGFLGYAYRGIAGASPGPTTGARGNLRDSALYPSGYGHVLQNWCVHFYKGVA